MLGSCLASPRMGATAALALGRGEGDLGPPTRDGVFGDFGGGRVARCGDETVDRSFRVGIWFSFDPATRLTSDKGLAERLEAPSGLGSDSDTASR